MSVRSIMKTAVLTTALLSTASVKAADNIGAWDPVEIGQNETQLLTKALSSNELYDESVTTRLCFLEIHSIVSQVVSGTKYKFMVEGCKLATGVTSMGECADGSANCVPTDYTVTVFEQPWTSTVRVLAIDAEETEPAGSMAASNETASAGSAESNNTSAGSAESNNTSAGSAESNNTTITTPTATTTNTTKAPASVTSPTTTPTPSSGSISLTGTVLLVAASIATFLTQ